MKSNRKPIWPYTDVVLRAHMGANQWSKTIRGRMRYFGVLSDPAAARRKFIAMLDEREEAEDAPMPARHEITLDMVVNGFLASRAEKVAKGEKSAVQFAKYRVTGKLVLSVLDRNLVIEDLTPRHFARLRAKLPGGLVTQSNAIRDIRTIFHWGQKHYGVYPRYGDEFDKPGKRAIRIASKPRVLWTAADIRKLLTHARPAVRAFILLGINCAFGQTDCSDFPRDKFDLTAHWFPRGKTGVERRCPLWPETMAALADYERARPKPGNEHRFFVTELGNAWVSQRIHYDADGIIDRAATKDNIGQELRKLCTLAKVRYRPFYTFRHTFRSVADEVQDSTAINCVMGHALGGMREVYTQMMGNGMKRLKAVTDHVHGWLFPLDDATLTWKK